MQEWQFFEWRRVLLAHTDTLLLSNLCEQQQQAVLAPGCSSCSRSAPWGVVQLLARPPSGDPCSCWSAATQHSRRTARKHSGDLGAIIMETKYVQVTTPCTPSLFQPPLTPLCNFTCSDTSTRDQWQLCNLCHPAQLSSQPWYPELSVCSLCAGALCKGQWTQVCNFLLFILLYVLMYWFRITPFNNDRIHDYWPMQKDDTNQSKQEPMNYSSFQSLAPC